MAKKSRQSSPKVYVSDIPGVRDSDGNCTLRQVCKLTGSHCAEAVPEQTRRRLAGEGRAELGPKDSVLGKRKTLFPGADRAGVERMKFKDGPSRL